MTYNSLIKRSDNISLNTQRYIFNMNTLKQDGMYLELIPIEEQTEELCLIAIYQKPISIQFVENQTEACKKLALSKYTRSIFYFKNITTKDLDIILDLEPILLFEINLENIISYDLIIEYYLNAIHKDLKLIERIKKIDKETCYKVLDIIKINRTSYKKDSYNIYDIISPIYKCNELDNELIEYAYNIDPKLIFFTDPKILTEEQILHNYKIDNYKYIYLLKDKKYFINNKLLHSIINNSTRINYDILYIIDTSCFNKESLKPIFEIIYNRYDFSFHNIIYTLFENKLINKQPEDYIKKYMYDNIDYIFDTNINISLSKFPKGFNHKKVIKFALKCDKNNKKYLNFWKTKVK